MRIVTVVLAFALVAAPSAAFAEVHEFYGCTFKEGRGTADLDKWLPTWKAVIDKTKMKDQFSAEVLTPQYDTAANLPDFFFMTTTPNANALGSELNEYFEGGAGNAVGVEPNKFAKCNAALYWSRKVYGK